MFVRRLGAQICHQRRLCTHRTMDHNRQNRSIWVHTHSLPHAEGHLHTVGAVCSATAALGTGVHCHYTYRTRGESHRGTTLLLPALSVSARTALC
jgi:hypothetical protein